MNWKPFIVFSTIVHIPQLIKKVVTGKTMAESRVIAKDDKFWTKTVISIHVISFIILLFPSKD